MLAMLCDHAGKMLFPQYRILRIIGRLAMPIYAYMIAEGCRHTRDRKKYLLRLFGMGVLCQAVYFVAMGSLYMCILITFSLSVLLIGLMDAVDREKSARNWSKLLAGTMLVFFLYSMIKHVGEDTNGLYLYRNDAMGYVLPARCFASPEEQAQFAEFIRKKAEEQKADNANV